MDTGVQKFWKSHRPGGSILYGSAYIFSTIILVSPTPHPPTPPHPHTSPPLKYKSCISTHAPISEVSWIAAQLRFLNQEPFRCHISGTYNLDVCATNFRTPLHQNTGLMLHILEGGNLTKAVDFSTT